MADILDVLEHLVSHATDLSPDNRAEHLDAVAEFAKGLGIEHAPPPEPEPSGPVAERDAEIARLKAELERAQAEQAQAQAPAG